VSDLRGKKRVMKAGQYENLSQTVSNVIKGLKKQKSKVTVLDVDPLQEVDQNGIVDYRGMKMTLQQREEYM
jgi:hypothetical protein